MILSFTLSPSLSTFLNPIRLFYPSLSNKIWLWVSTSPGNFPFHTWVWSRNTFLSLPDIVCGIMIPSWTCCANVIIAFFHGWILCTGWVGNIFMHSSVCWADSFPRLGFCEQCIASEWVQMSHHLGQVCSSEIIVSYGNCATPSVQVTSPHPASTCYLVILIMAIFTRQGWCLLVVLTNDFWNTVS